MYTGLGLEGNGNKVQLSSNHGVIELGKAGLFIIQMLEDSK